MNNFQVFHQDQLLETVDEPDLDALAVNLRDYTDEGGTLDEVFGAFRDLRFEQKKVILR